MKKAIILGALVIVVGGLLWMSKGSDGGSAGPQDIKYAEPADAVDVFYKAWLKAAQDATAQPDKATLAKSPILTPDLSAKIEAALAANASPDPVLCQTKVPAGITLRNVYEQGDKAQMLVTSKDKNVPNQAVVDLNKDGDTWVMSAIKCTEGEVAPVREFTFEQEGFLIKSSVPKPFNNKNWHIVFTKDGVPGNVVPLIFDGKSQCTNLEGVKAVCKPEQFMEASKVFIQGQMSERGATVVNLKFVK